MSKVRLFHEAVGHLVELNALSALEYTLDEATAMKEQALQTLPGQQPGVSMIVLDGHDRVRAANKLAALQYGTKRTALTGKRLWDLMPAAVGAFRQNIVALARAQGCRFHYLDNLSERWYDTFIEPLADVAGSVLIRALDVTDGAQFRVAGGQLQFIALQVNARTIE